MENLETFAQFREELYLAAAIIRTIFAQPNQQAARQQLEEVAKTKEKRWPQAAAVLRGGVDEVLTYMSFPTEHWTRLFSTNVLERLNRAGRRRPGVAGPFPG